MHSPPAMDMKKILEDIVNGEHRAVRSSHLMSLTFDAIDLRCGYNIRKITKRTERPCRWDSTALF